MRSRSQLKKGEKTRRDFGLFFITSELYFSFEPKRECNQPFVSRPLKIYAIKKMKRAGQ